MLFEMGMAEERGLTRLKKMIAVVISVFLCAFTYAVPSTLQKSDLSAIAVSEEEKTFTVEFKANRTTGYRWFLLKYDTHLIKPVSYQYKVPNRSMMGAPGISAWTFQVLPAATSVPSVTTITWLYARSWEKPIDAKMHAVTVYFTHN